VGINQSVAGMTKERRLFIRGRCSRKERNRQNTAWDCCGWCCWIVSSSKERLVQLRLRRSENRKDKKVVIIR
jgi:hypothetical protein